MKHKVGGVPTSGFKRRFQQGKMNPDLFITNYVKNVIGSGLIKVHKWSGLVSSYFAKPSLDGHLNYMVVGVTTSKTLQLCRYKQGIVFNVLI